MDNLSADMIQCEKDGYGVHYGKWKAMQSTVSINKQLPEGWKACEYCGKPFKTKCGKRFCDMECRNKSYAERDKAIKHNYYLHTYKAVRKEKRYEDKNYD